MILFRVRILHKISALFLFGLIMTGLSRGLLFPSSGNSDQIFSQMGNLHQNLHGKMGMKMDVRARTIIPIGQELYLGNDMNEAMR